jgi:hypothetical protein
MKSCPCVLAETPTQGRLLRQGGIAKCSTVVHLLHVLVVGLAVAADLASASVPYA